LKTVLVTGASGYIGSQTCKELKQAGYAVVAVDRNNIKHGYFDKQINNSYDSFDVQLALINVDAVVHIGATSLVGPSVADPLPYYSNNVTATLRLLEMCRAQGIHNFVFASSAATYGNATGMCYETDNVSPCNPYGQSKRIIELVLADMHTAYWFNSISLRFFNVAGADLDCEFGQEKQATHLIARIMESALAGKPVQVYGNDYDTKDGTCIRDYVHVKDIARGIVQSVKRLEQEHTVCDIINLGSGTGNSVFDIINQVNLTTGLNTQYEVIERRAGDPAILCADIEAAKTKLNWQPELKLDSIITSAYNWYNRSKKDILV
jgi:UDP-glucose-4-epimerase GalE